MPTDHVTGDPGQAPAAGAAAAGLPDVDGAQDTSERDAAEQDAAELIRRRLLAVEPGRRRRAVLLQHFRELAAEVLGVAPGAVDPAAPLATLGFTSVRTLELRTRLERSLRITLPATVGWQFPTLEALAPYLAERMGIDLDGSPLGAAATPGATRAEPAADEVGSLDELSDGDLEALLMARIEQLDEGRPR
jgi:acyl carrier protein